MRGRAVPRVERGTSASRTTNDPNTLRGASAGTVRSKPYSSEHLKRSPLRSTQGRESAKGPRPQTAFNLITSHGQNLTGEHLTSQNAVGGFTESQRQIVSQSQNLTSEHFTSQNAVGGFPTSQSQIILQGQNLTSEHLTSQNAFVGFTESQVPMSMENSYSGFTERQSQVPMSTEYSSGACGASSME